MYYLGMHVAKYMFSVEKVLISPEPGVWSGIAQKQETASWHMAWEPKKKSYSAD